MGEKKGFSGLRDIAGEMLDDMDQEHATRDSLVEEDANLTQVHKVIERSKVEDKKRRENEEHQKVEQQRIEEANRGAAERALRAEEKENGMDTYSNIKPISLAPALSTINGIGTRLYGCSDERFIPELGCRVFISTLYFVFFYIPILPIKRYVVSTYDNTSYRFYGSVPFTRFNWIHLLAGLCLIIFLVMNL